MILQIEDNQTITRFRFEKKQKKKHHEQAKNVIIKHTKIVP